MQDQLSSLTSLLIQFILFSPLTTQPNILYFILYACLYAHSYILQQCFFSFFLNNFKSQTPDVVYSRALSLFFEKIKMLIFIY